MAKKPLFHSVVYYVSPSLRSSRREQLQAALDAHGARASTTISDATHIITDTTRFDGWKEANEGAEIVTDRWVDRSVVLDRAEPPEMYSADPTMLFSGVTATCTDLLPADEIVIKTAITNLGGQWSSALTQNVTHLFALGPGTGSDKYALAMHNKRDTGMIVLLPHWFDDVIRLGTGKLDTKPYEWPEPAVLAGGGKPSGKLDKEKQQLLATATSETVPKSRAGEVWAGKKLHLAEDLELGERREHVLLLMELQYHQAVVGAIERAGGQVVDEWTDADAYICRYRSGKTFFQVARARKTIGTLDWVFFVLGTGQLTSPGDRLIHYPVPRRPIEEMAGKIFSITNYTGEARDYLKKLIVGMGASFNPTMRQGDSPILIAASTESEKAKKGAEWQIPVVNHLWVEDCYMTWRMLPVTTKYITFPPASDLSGLLCERGMGAYIENEENLRIEDNDDEEEAPVPPPVAISDEEEDEVPVPAPKKGKGRAVEDEDEPKKKGKKAAEDTTPANTKKTRPVDVTPVDAKQRTVSAKSTPALNKLGVKVVTKPHECTHLVVARIVRTSKFLCALPHVSHLVSEEWARQSAAQKKLLPESDFPVVDKEGEKKQRIKLTEVVERARALKGKLFAGHTFFITHKTTMDRDLLRSIITANGGQVSSASTNAPTVRTFKNDPKTKHLISSKEDAPVWRPIASEGFKVYTGEVVLDSALRQEVDWDNESYVLPEAKS
ncbi:hypothetical protein GGF50DRAFT_66503 [Schizophyllum commune]